MRFTTVAVIIFLSALPPAAKAADAPVTLGSKAFTESVVLGELATQLAVHDGVTATHRAQLGGSPVLWAALRRGEIDAYPEYTGTITHDLLPALVNADEPQVRAALAEQGVGMTRSLGFSDAYALGMLASEADGLGIRTISDLRSHPSLRFGFSNEFFERKDGWPGLRSGYALPQQDVGGLEHSLAYRAVAAAKTDVIDVYSTDADIKAYALRVLVDDRKVLPDYQAVFLYRLDLKTKSPRFLDALRKLEGAIDEPKMIAMNARANLDHVPEGRVASDFLRDALAIGTDANVRSRVGELWERTLQHLLLVGVSLAAAIVVAVPLGVLAYHVPWLGRVILATVSVIFTIPSLALLVFMIPLPLIGGLGTVPAATALFLYSLLPIVRNTHAGLAAIPAGLRESARVLGLPAWARLTNVELPMAMPSIMTGIQTAAVIDVGTATIGALIGAGGYGQLILSGVRQNDTRLILMGAIPAAVLALLVQGGFELLERVVVPRGLRIKARS